MPMFRKKPVVIEAVQIGPEPAPDWFLAAMESGDIDHDGEKVLIKTLEGVMTASKGDWVIQGIKGEIYPCKPDIFAATYETADAPQVIMDQLTDAILHGQGAVEIRHIPFAAELTPEQQKAFEEEWSKPHPGHITWLNDLSKPCPVSVDPGPAIGEHLTDIDADELPEDILARIRYDATLLVGRIAHLEAQLQAEGEHTEAANAEIERLKQANHTTDLLDPTSHPD